MTFRVVAAALACASALLAAAGPARAAGEPLARIDAFGLFETVRAGKAEKNERSAMGELHAVVAHRLLQSGTAIVGQLGSSFGAELRFENLPGRWVTVTVRTTHPPITNPATGKTTTISEFEWRVPQGESVYFGHTFQEMWQIAEGDWKSQVIYRGKVLAEQSFKVVVPLN
jgi:hypothetical protein